MSSLLALCCLPSVKKQKHDFFSLVHSVFVISRIVKVSVRVISLRLRFRALTSTLIILDITKTSSNTFLVLFFTFWPRSRWIWNAALPAFSFNRRSAMKERIRISARVVVDW